MAIVSLVIGVIILAAAAAAFRGFPLAIIGAFLGSGVIVFPVSITGLVLGIIAVRRKSRRGIAIAGIVLNLIPFLASIAVVIMWSRVGD